MKARFTVSTALFLCLSVVAFTAAFASPETMKGPRARPHRYPVRAEPETSFPRLVLFGALTLYQRYVSPIDGERCGFAPSCSAFAREAVGRSGAVPGIVLTADRLMRCTLFKGQGPDYLPLPDGKLFDPVENNLPWNP